MRSVVVNNTPIGFVKLQDSEWLEKQRVAGKVAAGALMLLEGLVKERSNLTLLEMNAKAEEYICDHDCSPTFKGYKGFPAGVCISIDRGNKHELVHGIPDGRHLEEGDMISFDLGTTYPNDRATGAIADTAFTMIVGKPRDPKHPQLIKDCEEALARGIAAIQVGKRLGVIGQAIYRYARDRGLSVITNYGGHSLDYDEPHASPFVANKALPDEGPRLQAGMTLALEPLFALGNSDTYVDEDDWTVNCASVCSHAEHTVYIHEDKVEVITARNYGSH